MNKEKIIDKNNLINYIYEKLSQYDIENKCNSIEFYNYNGLAFLTSSNNLIINYENIIEYFYRLSLHKKISKYKRNCYINLNMQRICLHKICHILQKEKEDVILQHASLYESYLKKKNMYSLNLYLNNPIERQANIFSYKELFNDLTHTKKVLIEDYNKILKYGYSVDDFPARIYFDNYDDFNIVKAIIGDLTLPYEKRTERGLNLTKNELNNLIY